METEKVQISRVWLYTAIIAVGLFNFATLIIVALNSFLIWGIHSYTARLELVSPSDVLDRVEQSDRRNEDRARVNAEAISRLKERLDLKEQD